MSKLAEKINDWYHSYKPDGERFWSYEMVEKIYKQGLISEEEFKEIVK